MLCTRKFCLLDECVASNNVHLFFTIKMSPCFFPVLLLTFFHSLRKRAQEFPLPCILPSGSLASLFSSSLSPSCLPLCCPVNPGFNFSPHITAPNLVASSGRFMSYVPSPATRETKAPPIFSSATSALHRNAQHNLNRKQALEGEEKAFLTVSNFARVYKCQRTFWNYSLFGPIYHIRERLPSQVVTCRQ